MPQKQPIKLIWVVSLKSLECLWVSIEIIYNITNTRQLTMRVRTREISFLGHIPDCQMMSWWKIMRSKFHLVARRNKGDRKGCRSTVCSVPFGRYWRDAAAKLSCYACQRSQQRVENWFTCSASRPLILFCTAQTTQILLVECWPILTTRLTGQQKIIQF